MHGTAEQVTGSFAHAAPTPILAFAVPIGGKFNGSGKHHSLACTHSIQVAVERTEQSSNNAAVLVYLDLLACAINSSGCTSGPNCGRQPHNIWRRSWDETYDDFTANRSLGPAKPHRLWGNRVIPPASEASFHARQHQRTCSDDLITRK